jgi:signal transduction histidine kinase
VSGVDDRAVWTQSCFVRERMEAMVASLLIVCIEPFWYFFDRALEPELALSFLPWRVGSALVGALCALGIARARGLLAVRAITLFNVLQTAAVVGVLTLQAEHRMEYFVGFSVVLWASGAFFTWPATWEAALCVGGLLVMLPAGLDAGPTTLVSVGAYLVSTAIVCVVGVGVRRSLHRRAYHASLALAAANDALEQSVRELRDAQARLVAAEKQAALGRMLAGLSHEIHNPLTIVQNTVDPLDDYFQTVLRLLDQARAANPADGALHAACADAELDFIRADQAEAVDSIRAACTRIRHIHQDLRNFVRGDTTALERSDPGQGLAATLRLFARGLPPGVQLHTDCPPLPAIDHSPGPLNQVFANLLQNALDAVGAEGEIRVQGRDRGDHLEFAFTDSGTGVPDAVLAHLFEPFFTTKGAASGTGLGLAISQQIAQSHGGRIELDRGHGPGARFVLRLPTRRGAAARWSGASA